MSVVALLSLIGVGLAVGLTSGLVGIGGGVLIVPFLYFFYGHPGWSGVPVSPAVEATIAHATSLFVIVPTSIFGTLRFQRARLVAWRAALPIAAFAMLAAVLGARLAVLLPEGVLKLAFGLLLIASGVNMLRRREAPERDRRGAPLAVTAPVSGVLVGLISALLGVGGGVIAIPLLVYLVGLAFRKVAATSLAIIMFAAFAGTVTYAMAGADAAALPPGTLGYVHVTAGIPIVAGSLLSVGWGAHLNQRLPVRRLRLIFAIVFLLLGLNLVIRNLEVLT